MVFEKRMKFTEEHKRKLSESKKINSSKNQFKKGEINMNKQSKFYYKYLTGGMR